MPKLPCPKLPPPSQVLPELEAQAGEVVGGAGAGVFVSTPDGSEKGTRERENGAEDPQAGGGEEKEEGGGRTRVGMRLSNR